MNDVAVLLVVLVLVARVSLGGEGSRDAAASQEPSDSAVWAKVAEAHTVMWRDYIDPHTFQIYTFLDPQTLRPRLPSYAEVAARKPSRLFGLANTKNEGDRQGAQRERLRSCDGSTELGDSRGTTKCNRRTC